MSKIRAVMIFHKVIVAKKNHDYNILQYLEKVEKNLIHLYFAYVVLYFSRRITPLNTTITMIETTV